MLKLPDNLGINFGVNPVDRVLPVLAVENIGSTLQELNARATQFVKGQEYVAHVLSKVDDKAYLVKVDNAVLKMELGNAAQTGQTLQLRYMQDSPVPTFLLAPTIAKSTESTTQLSPAATLLGQYLKEAESSGVSNRYEATAVVTHSPKNPPVIAQDLKQTISNSGLFYESHLNEAVQGQRPMAALIQEPQNQHNTQIASLMAQQLATMENQRISWHGEVWPGQKMDWDIHFQDRQSAEEGAHQESFNEESRPVSSELTLHLPNLGSVTARLNVADGHMRINISAQQASTLDLLKGDSHSLAKSIKDNGLKLDALTVVLDE